MSRIEQGAKPLEKPYGRVPIGPLDEAPGPSQAAARLSRRGSDGMGGAQAGSTNRGNQADYMLGTAEGWDAFSVVRWHGVEEISQPYRYDITLQRTTSSGPADLDKLLDAGATFRIASQRAAGLAHRPRHPRGGRGDRPHRRRSSSTASCSCRTSGARATAGAAATSSTRRLQDVISAVLENRSPVHPEGKGGLVRFTDAQAPDQHPSFSSFTPPTGSYRWDVADTSRIEDRTKTVRPYVAQYNESDFDFVARLLEEEGLSYYFEHGRDQGVFAITDTPGDSPMFDTEPTFTMRRVNRTGAASDQEIVRAFRDTRRMRSRAVTIRDWDYNRSARPLQATIDEAPDDPELSRHFEFPVGEELVQDKPGMHAADVRMQRYDAERAHARGREHVRTMEPGYRFTLHDADGISQDAKLLAVRVETFATELTPQATILDEEPLRLRGRDGRARAGLRQPLRRAARGGPASARRCARRGRGSTACRPAVVTAEEYPKDDRPVINADTLARVRVRFPWDQREDKDDKTPTSDWLRVSQYWAGGELRRALHPARRPRGARRLHAGRPGPAGHRRPGLQRAAPAALRRVEGARPRARSRAGARRRRRRSTASTRSASRTRRSKEEIYLHAQRNLNEVVLASPLDQRRAAISRTSSDTTRRTRSRGTASTRSSTTRRSRWWPTGRRTSRRTSTTR